MVFVKFLGEYIRFFSFSYIVSFSDFYIIVLKLFYTFLPDLGRKQSLRQARAYRCVLFGSSSLGNQGEDGRGGRKESSV